MFGFLAGVASATAVSPSAAQLVVEGMRGVWGLEYSGSGFKGSRLRMQVVGFAVGS